MKQKKKVILLKTVTLLIAMMFVLLVYIDFNYQIRYRTVDLNRQTFGIIDDSLSREYNNVETLNPGMKLKDKNMSHGDNLLNFVQNNYTNYSIYYFNAEIDGKISSESILEGLNTLKDKGVQSINISLSSKMYSQKIQDWILENNNIKVYASYNNMKNSFDYPAMYKGVIASGIEEKEIQYKDTDIKYATRKIFCINKMNLYEGNSFLSLISMLENKED